MPVQLWIALGLAVWVVYVLDRLLDVRRARDESRLEMRHHIHERYRGIFWVGVALAIVAGSYIALYHLPRTVIIYAGFIGVLTVGYFFMAWNQSGGEHTGILKNVVAGLTFAFGAAAGPHAYSPLTQFPDFLFSPEIYVFGAVCAINMTAIDFWKLTGEDEDDAASLLGTATLLVAALALWFSFSGDDFNKPLYYAAFVGAAGLNLLNRFRDQFDQFLRRVWVDLVILFPVLVYWFWTAFDSNTTT